MTDGQSPPTSSEGEGGVTMINEWKDDNLRARLEQEGLEVEQETDKNRTPEMGCLEGVRSFNLGSFVRESLAFYREHPAQAKTEVLSGITLALIEVPESVAFAFMAGVDPSRGMQSVFWIGIITGLFGGRPGMISGAAGAMSVVLGDLMSESGPLKGFTRQERLEQLLMSVFLIGVIEIGAGPLVAMFVKIIPQSAMLGFMNALAIIISKAQMDSFQVCGDPDVLFTHCEEGHKVWLGLKEARTWTLIMVLVVTMAIMLGFPKLGRFGRLVPASLVAILVGTAIEWGINRPLLHAATRTVGETASLSGFGLPQFHWPQLPPQPAWTPIWTYAISVALIGLIETVMTQEVVNTLTRTPPSSFASNQECLAQGFANLICGLFGAIGGSALIGETVINILHGASGRLSSTTAGVTMLVIILCLSPLVAYMPVATLTGVIFVVAIHTFQWKNLVELHRLPRVDTLVIVVVTILSVLTNLAVGVVVGVVISSLCHVWVSGMSLNAKATTILEREGNRHKVYELDSPLFFGSVRPLLQCFSYEEDPDLLIVDLHPKSSIRDFSGLTALNEAGKRYQELGKTLVVRRIDPNSRLMVQKCRDQASHLVFMEDEVDVTTGEHHVELRRNESTSHHEGEVEAFLSLEIEPSTHL